MWSHFELSINYLGGELPSPGKGGEDAVSSVATIIHYSASQRREVISSVEGSAWGDSIVCMVQWDSVSEKTHRHLVVGVLIYRPLIKPLM